MKENHKLVPESSFRTVLTIKKPILFGSNGYKNDVYLIQEPTISA